MHTTAQVTPRDTVGLGVDTESDKFMLDFWAQYAEEYRRQHPEESPVAPETWRAFVEYGRQHPTPEERLMQETVAALSRQVQRRGETP